MLEVRGGGGTVPGARVEGRRPPCPPTREQGRDQGCGLGGSKALVCPRVAPASNRGCYAARRAVAGTHLPPHPHPATPRVAIAAGTARKSLGGPRGGAARGGWGREGVARVQAASAPSARSSARTAATAAGSAPRGALVSGRAGRERSAPGRCPGPAGRSGMAAGGAGRGVGARRVARLRARPAGRHSDCRRGRFAAALPELSSWRTGWAILPGEMSKVRTTKWVGHKAE